MDSDPIVARLRAAGCVFAEDEAAFIRRHLDDPHDIERAVTSRASGLPLEHAVGAAEFAGAILAVADGVFVPRRRAETLAHTAAAQHPTARVVVDLGCGCGALAASMTTRLPSARVHAVDVDPTSVVVARLNGRRYGFAAHHGSWWDGLPSDLRGRVDLAVGYLPHVPTHEVRHIHADFRAHEPLAAVDGGSDGLDHLRTVLAGLPDWLAPGGRFVTLLSAEQARRIDGEVLARVDGDAVVAFG